MLLFASWIATITALSSSLPCDPVTSRRTTLGWIVAGGGATAASRPTSAAALTDAVSPPPITAESLEIEQFLRTGIATNAMGISGQAGKSRPETGVILRRGSEVSRDPRTGDVLAEILLKSKGAAGNADLVPVLASYAAPWPLQTGSVFDVECRDLSTGDGAFLAVSQPIGGNELKNLPDSFFLDELFSPTGRFSFYGQPTDFKVKNSQFKNNCKMMDVAFSTLSQSTQTEIPRLARIAATIPEGTTQVVMLVSSASASRWRKGSDQQIAAVADSFRVIPAPPTNLKVRAKERGY